jgi:type IV fimbrial biogenesis protein FimT
MFSRRQHAFSLTESVVTLAVVATLAAVAAPDVSEFVHSLRVQAVAGDVLYGVMLARSEAIKRNARVALCRSADGVWCAPSGDWGQGAILFQDRNNSGTRESGEPMLQRLAPPAPGWRVTGNGPVARYVSYGPLGSTRLTSGAFQAGTITVCRASAQRLEARQVVINGGGRPRLQKVWLDRCP